MPLFLEKRDCTNLYVNCEVIYKYNFEEQADPVYRKYALKDLYFPRV